MITDLAGLIGFKLPHVLPPPPQDVAWNINMGTDFAFPPVEKACDGAYRVTSAGVRWWVTTYGVPGTPADQVWTGSLIKHYTDQTPTRTVHGATAADVIAAIFALRD